MVLGVAPQEEDPLVDLPAEEAEAEVLDSPRTLA